MTPGALRALPPDLVLKQGNHKTAEEGMCLLEAVAHVAGEPHSSHPACACPVLSSFGRFINDGWLPEERQLLIPLIPRLVGSQGPIEVEHRRAYMLVDATLRTIVPMSLEAMQWTDLANRLREIDQVTDKRTAQRAYRVSLETRAEIRGRLPAVPTPSTAAISYAGYAANGLVYAAIRPLYADVVIDCGYAIDSVLCAVADNPRLTAARRPVIEATLRAYERALAITDSPGVQSH